MGATERQLEPETGREGSGLRQAEAALRASDERLHSILDGALDAVITIDDAGAITAWNPQAAAIFGWTREDICGRLLADTIIPERYRKAHRVGFERYLATGEGPLVGKRVEIEGLRRDGTEFPIELSIAQTRAGGVLSLTAFVRDITQRRRTEESLRESERRLQSIFNQINGFVGILLPDGTVIEINDAPLRAGGFVRDDVVGKLFWETDFFRGSPAAQKATKTEILAVATGDQVQGEFAYFTAAGEERTGDRTVTPIKDDAGRIVLIIVAGRDVTARKRAEEALRESGRRAAFLAEASDLLAQSLDYETTLGSLAALLVPRIADLCVVQVLDEPDQMRRLEVAVVDEALREVVGQLHLGDWRAPAPGDEPGEELIGARLAGGKALFVPHITDAWLRGAAPDPGQYALVQRVEARSLIMAPLTLRGRWLGVLSLVTTASSGRTLVDEDRMLVQELSRRAALAIENARLFRNVQDTAEALLQANAAKDEFLGLVSHELRTPITTIYGNAQVLRRNADHISEQDRALAICDIEEEADRLKRVVDNMMTLARFESGRVPQLEPTLIARNIEGLAASHRERFPQRDVRVRVEPELDPAMAEPTYFELVLRNLLSNAEKYSPVGAPIEIRAERSGHEIVVRVLDRGAGIAAEDAEHIFEAFYRAGRTSSRATGAGMGLAVCKRLVEAQSGRIWAGPREGGGAEVSFALPLEREAGR